jgi:hypothetical protein
MQVAAIRSAAAALNTSAVLAAAVASAVHSVVRQLFEHDTAAILAAAATVRES